MSTIQVPLPPQPTHHPLFDGLAVAVIAPFGVGWVLIVLLAQLHPVCKRL